VLFSFQSIHPPGWVESDISVPGVPAQWVGFVERTFFTLSIWFAGPAPGPVFAAMIGWMALKFAVNWKRRDVTDDVKALTIIRNSMGSVLASLVSMLFALGGGIIIRELGVGSS
jgi:hypothetical protein